MVRQFTIHNLGLMRENALKAKSFEDFRQHYVFERSAYDPGFAGSQGEYLYQNNGDNVPDHPWTEVAFSDTLLQLVLDFWQNNPSGNIFQLATHLIYAGSYTPSCFTNVAKLNSYLSSERYTDYQWASKKKVPDNIKKRFAKFKRDLGIKRKTPYLFQKRFARYAIKDRKYGVVIFDDGTILYRGWLFSYTLDYNHFDKY